MKRPADTTLAISADYRQFVEELISINGSSNISRMSSRKIVVLIYEMIARHSSA
jgi:hypothetical protein